MQTLLWWSSGKDSAWALHQLRRQPDVHVAGLVTTVNEAFERATMHATRLDLLHRQAEAVGLPLHLIYLPHPCPNEAYEQAVHAFTEQAVHDGITHMAFGDLFLADVRAYRERLFDGTGITPLFPLWDQPTDRLANAMVGGGLRAIVTCVDPQQLDPSFAGRTFDAHFLADLPTGVDPCGERGEFHTFVYAGPMLAAPLAVQVGATVEREGFVFADVVAQDRPS